jgi:ATP-dependent DNA helicase RecQ
VVRALEYLEQKGWAELRPSDLRHRFVREADPSQTASLVEELARRFAKREEADISRIEQVLGLVTASACQSAALAHHFGEELAAPCGGCSFCRHGAARVLPPPQSAAPLPSGFDVEAFTKLREAHPAALGHPRQAARFLCGLTSPATTRAKLSRHPLFGALVTRRFGEVLAWMSGAS